MRKQEIKLHFGVAAQNPDAEVSLRSALAMVKLLESVDRKTWRVGHSRYRWEISDTSHRSPCMIELSGVFHRNRESYGDVVGKTIECLRGITRGDENAIRLLDASDLKLIAHLANGKPSHQIPMSVEIPSPEGPEYETFVVTDSTRRQAEIFRLQLEEREATPRSEYVVMEGELYKIEARRDKGKYVLGLIDRDTGKNVECHFNPMSTADLGAHMNHVIQVEGELTVSDDGTSRLDVFDYHVFSKAPLSLEDIHEMGLRCPDGMTTDEYMRSIREDE